VTLRKGTEAPIPGELPNHPTEREEPASDSLRTGKILLDSFDTHNISGAGLRPVKTEAFTPMLTYLCFAAVSRIPVSLGKSPWASDGGGRWHGNGGRCGSGTHTTVSWSFGSELRWRCRKVLEEWWRKPFFDLKHWFLALSRSLINQRCKA
jgi:hypothetical protein